MQAQEPADLRGGGGGGDLRAGGSEILQGGGIEGGDQDPLLHVVVANHSAEWRGEWRAHLFDLDVQPQLGKREEDLLQSGNSNSLSAVGIAGALVGGPLVAGVEGLDLRQSKLTDRPLPLGGGVGRGG